MDRSWAASAKWAQTIPDIGFQTHIMVGGGGHFLLKSLNVYPTMQPYWSDPCICSIVEYLPNHQILA